jgi:hypothetical protein
MHPVKYMFCISKNLDGESTMRQRAYLQANYLGLFENKLVYCLFDPPMGIRGEFETI